MADEHPDDAPARERQAPARERQAPVRERDSALVHELAELARLELAPDEARALGAQLETILGYIRGLQAVDVEGTPEYLSAEQVRSGLRDDTEGPRFDVEQALAGVPELRDRQVAVPRFKD